MALTNEDIQAIASLLQPIKDDVQDLKSDVQVLKSDVQVLKSDVQVLKSDVQVLKNNVHDLNTRTTNIELTLENETNKNIQLLAENHISLIDKLNQSIKVADKNSMFEVQMASFKSRLEIVEKEVAELKNNIA